MLMPGHIHGWLGGIFYFFVGLGAPGLFLLGVLDSSFLALPFANDVTVIVLASLHHNKFFLYVVAATAGSALGSWIIYRIAHAGGETFLRAHVSPKTFDRMQARIGRTGPILLAVPALIPPPFPFTAFVAGAGALEVSEAPFMLTLIAMRFARFLAESLAALYFGRGIVRWLRTPAFHAFIDFMVGLAILASAYSIWRLIQTARRGSRGSRPADESGRSGDRAA